MQKFFITRRGKPFFFDIPSDWTLLFPGVADFDSILDHHFKYTFHEGTGLGKLQGNLFYEHVCSIARNAKLHFVINSIMDPNDHVADVVAGDPVAAHLKGVEKSKRLVFKAFARKADLTVITSFPYTEGPQIVKPLVPASLVTREGGCIILFAECSGNLPDPFVHTFQQFHAKHRKDLRGPVLRHFQNNSLIMEGGAIDFNMALGLTLALQHLYRIILVSEDIPRDKGERMGFLFAETLEEAFALSREVCPKPKVHVIPSGGILLPAVEVNGDQRKSP